MELRLSGIARRSPESADLSQGARTRARVSLERRSGAFDCQHERLSALPLCSGRLEQRTSASSTSKGSSGGARSSSDAEIAGVLVEWGGGGRGGFGAFEMRGSKTLCWFLSFG